MDLFPIRSQIEHLSSVKKITLSPMGIMSGGVNGTHGFDGENLLQEGVSAIKITNEFSDVV